jgi:hypothetical protein
LAEAAPTRVIHAVPAVPLPLLDLTDHLGPVGLSANRPAGHLYGGSTEMAVEDNRPKRPRRKRKTAAKLDLIINRFTSVTAALAALVAVLHGTGLL